MKYISTTKTDDVENKNDVYTNTQDINFTWDDYKSFIKSFFEGVLIGLVAIYAVTGLIFNILYWISKFNENKEVYIPWLAKASVIAKK